MTRTITSTTSTTLNHKEPPRWEELSQESKDKLLVLKNATIQYLVMNPYKKVSWETLNKSGLWHWYNWFSNDYNYSHQWSKIQWDDEGIYLTTNNVCQK